MKAYASLLTILLALHALPAVAQLAAAGKVRDAAALQREDEYDGRRLQNDYWITYANGSTVPPYSIEEVDEKIQILADGNQIKTKETMLRYRDQKGRVRSAYKSIFGGERIFIADPDAKTAWLIRPEREDVLRIQGTPPYPRIVPPQPRPIKAPEWSKRVETPLGVKEIAGVKAVGTRIETFFPPGAKGNDKEMVEATESWRSYELSETVYYRSSSPRYGETIRRFESVKLADPESSVFSIPAGYTIRDTVQNAPAAPE